MDFNNLVEDVLNEVPVSDISQIRSTKFTEHPPTKAKFQRGQQVALRGLDYASNPAFRKYGGGAVGKIVGMQRNTGPARTAFGAAPMNRYYVRFEDGKIWPVSSFHLTPIG